MTRHLRASNLDPAGAAVRSIALKCLIARNPYHKHSQWEEISDYSKASWTQLGRGAARRGLAGPARADPRGEAQGAGRRWGGPGGGRVVRGLGGGGVLMGELFLYVMERGFVLVGRPRPHQPDALFLTLDDVAVVRRWGTSAGLGQLATQGPTESSVIDPEPDGVEVSRLAIYRRIACNKEAWAAWRQNRSR